MDPNKKLIAERFAALPFDKRKTFLGALSEKGIQFARLPIIPSARTVSEALSYAQQRQWFLWRLEPESTAYHIAGALRLEGALDVEALRASFARIVERHETLRTVFRAGEDGLGEQVIEPVQGEGEEGREGVDIPVLDLRQSPAGEREARAMEEAQRVNATPFDLTRGPLLRVKLLRMDEDQHILIVVMHHIVSDGWSMQIIVDEFVSLYRARIQGQAAALPPLPIQYTDYAVWQRNWLEAGEKERQLAYWQRQLGDEHPVLALPTDHPRHALANYHAARHTFNLSDELPNELPGDLGTLLKQAAQARGATLFMVLLAGFQVLLYRYTGQPDIRVGVPIANRNRVETEGVVGFFVNTQVLRNRLHSRMVLSEVLDQAARASLDAQSHQDLPFEQLVEALHPERSLSHSPLFQVMHNHHHGDDSVLEQLPGLSLSTYSLGEQGAQFELTLDTQEHPGGEISVCFTYAAELFEAETIVRLGTHYLRILQGFAHHPEKAVGEIELLDGSEHERLRNWGRNERRYAAAEPVHWLIEQQVRQRPDAVALIFGEEELSYGELNLRANRLAHRLIERGVGPDVRVGIALERSVEMIVGLLGILKAGGAYVPLDPAYPAERLAYMVADSGIFLLLTQAGVGEGIPRPEGLAVMEVEEGEEGQGGSEAAGHDPQVALHGEHLAYVIYTSGSTGKPKGVGNRHRALYNRLTWMQEAYGLNHDDCVLQKTPFSFDVSVWEFFWPLMTGARLAVAAPGDHRDPARIVALIQQHRVTTLHFVPSMLQIFMAHEGIEACTDPSHLSRIICSGEALLPEMQAKVFERLPGVELHNLYGPTEAAIDVTYWKCIDEGKASIPIGRPIANIRTCILDPELNLVPIGVAGELYLGGMGLARSYLNRAGLTSERFVADPFDGTGGRLYRTGDLARWRSDGQIEYLGRLDHQVKVRGFRIELGEIEAQLLGQAGVREAVVVTQEGPGGTRLVGYVTPDGAGAAGAEGAAGTGEVLDALELKGRLSEVLPDYMVPSALVVLECLPLNPNGKIDRSALPDPEWTGSGYEAPQGEAEAALAAIWAEVLGIERVGRQDNFFELGGDSILSLQIVARLRRAGWKITPKQLFERQTVMSLAGVAERSENAEIAPEMLQACPAFSLSHYLAAEQIANVSVDTSNVEDVYPLSPLQKGMLLQSLDTSESGLYINQLNVEVEGLDIHRFEQAFQAVIQRHSILRTGFLWQSEFAEPLQLVYKRVDFTMAVADWRGTAVDPDRIAAFAAEDLHRGFDVLKAPLMRVNLIRLDDLRYQLVWTTHHILLDGWSTSRLVNELFAHYSGQSLPHAGRRYAEYIHWLGQQDVLTDEKFWKASLCKLDGPTLLAGDTQTGRTGYTKLYSRFDSGKTRSYEQFARQQRVTLNTLIQAAWGLLLKQRTRAEAAVFGATVAGRPASLPGVEEMLGLFINTLPIVIDAKPEQQVGTWLRQLQANNVRYREHEHTPLYEIQRWVGSAGRPLFDSIIVFENFPVSKILEGQDKAGLRFGPTEGEGLTGFAMDLQVVIEDTLEIEYCYSRSQFTDAFVMAIRQQMEHLLEQMVQDAYRTIGELQWVERDAQAQLLGWGHGDKRYQSNVPVHRLIERQAEKQPDAIALLLGDEELSYGDLNLKANQLAHRLIRLGITPETRVGVALERSLDMIVALLAVLKAGGAYVPLDTDYPVDRLTYMINDSGIRLVLTQDYLRSRLNLPERIEVLMLNNIDLRQEPEQNPAIGIAEQNLAYIIYTSGSTGQPKGVAVEHGPLAMHCQATAEIYEMASSWRELQFMSFSFDGAHERWLTTLISGAGLALRDAELWPVEQSYQALHRYNITNAVFPPAYLGQLAEWAETRDDRPTMELYVFGGEAMPKATFERIRQSLRPRMLINGYGPTETVVTPLIWKVDAHTSFEGTYAPIGRPVGERTAYILDDNLQLVPQGVAGELYIGGFGLARGYFGRPGLTAERFVADPFHTGTTGGRLYRTGDLVRWLPDGTVEYLGRVDHQVKIRGFRIELGEIEARLLAIEGIDQAAVIAQPALSGTGQQLVAYIAPKIPDDPSLSPAQVKQLLTRSLPDYMIPGNIVVLAKLPATPNGKLDRQNLPQPGSTSESAYVAPSTPEAKALAEIWQSVLKVERVGQTDNFFELGGNSLSCLQVMARMRGLGGKVTGIKLRDLMQRPTIASLLELDPAPTAMLKPLAMNAIRKDVPPLFCFHPGMGTVFDYQPLSRQLQGQRTVYGFPCRMLSDPAHRDPSLNSMAVDYSRQIMDIQPEGPYYLLGWSLGGTLAVLAAHFLEKQGHEVAFLGLVDTFVPDTEACSDDWLADLDNFIALVLPECDSEDIERHLTEYRLNRIQAGEDSARSILEALEAKGTAGRAPDFAGLETDELVRMFLVARHLKTISQQAGHLPALKVRPTCWWSAARPQHERRALRQQIAQADLVEIELAADHFGIIRAQDFLDQVPRALLQPMVKDEIA